MKDTGRGMFPSWLIMLAIAAPTCLGAVLYGLDVGQQVAILEREVASAHLSASVLDALIEARANRPDEARRQLERARAFESRLGPSPGVESALRAAREALAGGNGDRSVPVLVDCVKTVGEAGGLILDTDAASYAVMDSFVVQFPEVVASEHARQALEPLITNPGASRIEVAGRTHALNRMLRLSLDGIQRDVRDGFRLEPELTTRLAVPALELERALLADTPSREARESGTSGSARLDRIDAAFRAYRAAATDTFVELVEQRLGALRGHAFRILSGLMGLLLLALTVAAGVMRQLSTGTRSLLPAAGEELPDGESAELATGPFPAAPLRERGQPVSTAGMRWAPETDQEAV